MPLFDFYPQLENKRVLLRPLVAEDIQELAPLALGEPELCRYTATRIMDRQGLERYIDLALRERDSQISIPFLVVDKVNNRVAGSTRYMPVAQHKRVEIGWTWIGKAYQGTGLNKAMKWLMLQHAFEQMDMNRVELKTSERNLTSQSAIQSIGGVREGVLRSHMINDDGTVRNSVYYSIIKEEWPAVKSNVFQKYLKDWY
jgi:RimJ/RimL family protein N-acetyltransferase